MSNTLLHYELIFSEEFTKIANKIKMEMRENVSKTFWSDAKNALNDIVIRRKGELFSRINENSIFLKNMFFVRLYVIIMSRRYFRF